MASNRGKRFGSLMTSFRSPTSTGKSIDLRGGEGDNYGFFSFYNMSNCEFTSVLLFLIQETGFGVEIYIEVELKQRIGK